MKKTGEKRTSGGETSSFAADFKKRPLNGL